MPSSLRERAYFWRPDQRDKAVAGLLVADDDDIRVELDGAFEEPAELLKVSARYPVIHGIMPGGRPISLFGVVHNQTHVGLGYWRQGLWANYALVGAQLTEPRFVEVSYRLDHLPDWVSRTGIKPSVEQGAWRLDYRKPERLTATVDDGEVSIGFAIKATNSPHKSGFEESVWLTGISKQPLTLRELTDRLLFPVRDLITVAVGSGALIEEITVTSPEASQKMPDGTERLAELILFHRYLQPDPSVRHEGRLKPEEMIFGLEDWTDGFPALVSRWLELRSKLDAALNLVVGLAYAPPRWGDTTVMIWAQALEAYHRIVFKGGAADKVAQERHKRVMEACPREDREWLAVRLEHADEPSLGRRVKDVCERARPVIEALLSVVKDFPTQMSETRNAYAHFGAASTKESVGAELRRLSETARWVVIANLLLDLGFEPSKARALIQRNEEYADLVKNPLGDLVTEDQKPQQPTGPPESAPS